MSKRGSRSALFIGEVKEFKRKSESNDKSFASKAKAKFLKKNFIVKLIKKKGEIKELLIPKPLPIKEPKPENFIPQVRLLTNEVLKSYNKIGLLNYFNQLIYDYENVYIPKKPSLHNYYEDVRNAIESVGHLRVEIIKLQNKIREIEIANHKKIYGDLKINKS